MKSIASIKLKAYLLLILFSLNTIVGFACSLGLDMGYNSTHHGVNEVTEALVHIHKDGKKHVHHEKKESHNHDKSHTHDEANSAEKTSKEKDNCCRDEVMNFQQIDKSIPNSVNINYPVFFTAFVAVYYNIDLLSNTDFVRDIKPFVRSYHPPIPDIRIAIQSFLI